MASSQSTADYILDQLAGAGTVTAKKMFGEYGIYCNGQIVAFVADEQLFVKPTAAGKAFIGDYTEGAPYPGAKPHLLVSGDHWDDDKWLSQLIKVTAAELSVVVANKKSDRKQGRRI